MSIAARTSRWYMDREIRTPSWRPPTLGIPSPAPQALPHRAAKRPPRSRMSTGARIRPAPEPMRRSPEATLSRPTSSTPSVEQSLRRGESPTRRTGSPSDARPITRPGPRRSNRSGPGAPPPCHGRCRPRPASARAIPTSTSWGGRGGSYTRTDRRSRSPSMTPSRESRTQTVPS